MSVNAGCFLRSQSCREGLRGTGGLASSQGSGECVLPGAGPPQSTGEGCSRSPPEFITCAVRRKPHSRAQAEHPQSGLETRRVPTSGLELPERLQEGWGPPPESVWLRACAGAYWPAPAPDRSDTAAPRSLEKAREQSEGYGRETSRSWGSLLVRSPGPHSLLRSSLGVGRVPGLFWMILSCCLDTRQLPPGVPGQFQHLEFGRAPP